MKQGIEWIKSHPALSGIIALIVFVAAFLIAKSKGSSSNASTPSGVEGLSQNDLEFMQIQAGLQAQSMNDSTQITLGQQNEQVENNYIDTSGAVAENQTSAELEATEAGYSTEENIAGDQESEAEDEISAGLSEQEANLTAAEKEIGNVGGAANQTSLLETAMGFSGAGEETEQLATQGAEVSGAQNTALLSGLASSLGAGLFGL